MNWFQPTIFLIGGFGSRGGSQFKDYRPMASQVRVAGRGTPRSLLEYLEWFGYISTSGHQLGSEGMCLMRVCVDLSCSGLKCHWCL